MPVQNVKVISGIMKAHSMDLCYGKELVLTGLLNGKNINKFDPKICSPFCHKCNKPMDAGEIVSSVEREFDVVI